MKKKLELLCNYLKKNGYEDDSKRVEEIMHDICANYLRWEKPNKG